MNNSVTKSLYGKWLLTGFFVVIVSSMCIILSTNKAEAIVWPTSPPIQGAVPPDYYASGPGNTTIPSDDINDVPRCDDPVYRSNGQYNYFGTWISNSGTPTSLVSINVIRGVNDHLPIPLSYNMMMVNCLSQSQTGGYHLRITQNNMRALPAGVTGLAPRPAVGVGANGANAGASGVAYYGFSYQRPGGFPSSGQYDLNFRFTTTTARSNGTFACVNTLGNPRNINNLNDDANCFEWNVNLILNVNVIFPSCSISNIVRFSDGSPSVQPGDRLRFNVNVFNGQGTQLGANGPTADPLRPNDPSWGFVGNYLVSGSQWARGPTINSSVYTATVNTLAFSYTGGAQAGFNAPGSPGTYQFNWGLVNPSVPGWVPITCRATLTVSAPVVVPTCTVSVVRGGTIVTLPTTIPSGVTFRIQAVVRNPNGSSANITNPPGVSYAIAPRAPTTAPPSGTNTSRSAVYTSGSVPANNTPRTFYSNGGTSTVDNITITSVGNYRATWTIPTSLGTPVGCNVDLQISAPSISCAAGAVSLRRSNGAAIVPARVPAGQAFSSRVNVTNTGGSAVGITSIGYSVTAISPTIMPSSTGINRPNLYTSGTIPTSPPRTFYSNGGTSTTDNVRIDGRGNFRVTWNIRTTAGGIDCVLDFEVTLLPPSCAVQDRFDLDVGIPFTPEVTITNPNALSFNLSAPVSYTMTGPSGFTASGAGTPNSGPVAPGGPGRLIRSTTQQSLPVSGTYSITWTINTSIGPAEGECGSAQAAYRAASKPYVRFYGKNVIAGGGYSASNVCTPAGSPSARAFGFFDGAASHQTYKGSASELAVFARGAIEWVLPGSQIVDGSRTILHELGFANSNDPYATGTFGGDFETTICAQPFPDAAELSTFGAIVGGDSIDRDGRFRIGTPAIPQNVTLSGGSIADGNRFTLHVDGDVTITGNIWYANNNWGTNRNAIPLFRVYATGNIFIDSSVSRLEGLYNAGNAIYTCTNGSNSYSIADPAGQASYYAACSASSLVVNGSFIAQDIYLQRVRNTIANSTVGERAGSSSAAEVFQFSPELYLALMSEEENDPERETTFDSIFSLPPAL